jgi:hypothetical protein
MKWQSWKAKAKRSLTPLWVVGVLVLLLASPSTVAWEPERAIDDRSAGPLGWGEEGIKEVGVEWINDFPGTVDDRSHWDESCDGLYYQLLDEGWTGRFRWTDWAAWERDFKDESRGGAEDSVADTVDIAMVCTHGAGTWDSFWNKSLSSVYFGSTVGDHHLVPGDAYQAYGDQDLEWLAFDSCSVLGGGPSPYYNRGYWAATMNGLHLLLGFRNTMYVYAPGDGDRWAHYMLGFKWLGIWWRPPYKVTQAWFEAVDDVQPGGVCARVLAEESYFFNDYLHGRGTVYADHVDGDYTYQDHCSCTPPPLQIEEQRLAQIETMPVYQITERQVDEDYVLGVASAFRMAGGVEGDDGYYYMVNSSEGMTYTLQVDRASGGYKYRNQSALWATPIETPTLPLGDEAVRIGNEFFTGDGKDLPGAAYRTGETLTQVEEQVEVTKLNPAAGILAEEEIGRTPINVSLSFGRVIPAQVGVRTEVGIQQADQDISVVGPGARAKMYLGDLGDILGVQGGSRDIAATGQSVTIMDAEKAWDLFLADPTIAVAEIPWVADEISKTAQTLAYYEYPHAQSQKELIPVWVFTADFYSAGTPLAEDVLVYVPAAAEYLPPEVSIAAPTAGSRFRAGESVTLSGSVVQYGSPPFSYAWSSSQDGPLGNGASLTVPLSGAIKGGEVISQTISLKVTDANGQRGMASVQVSVQPDVYLPVIINKP